MNAIRVTLAVMKSNRIKVQHVVDRDDAEDPDVVTVNSADSPMETFRSAVDSLKIVAAQMCEVKNAAEWARNIVLDRVEFAWKRENGTLSVGVKIKGRKPLAKSADPMPFETSWKWELTPYTAEDAKAFCLTEKQVEAVLEIASEAGKYAKGQRAQMLLPMAG